MNENYYVGAFLVDIWNRNLASYFMVGTGGGYLVLEYRYSMILL
jgi:hypothetical protein